MEFELVYFFNCAIIVLLLSAGRNYSGIHGLCIGPALLIACCVKAISIHVITNKLPDPIGTTIGNLSQLSTHRRIGLSLQVQVG